MEESRNYFKRIENLQIGLQPRAELILICLGLKPATEFKIYGHTYNPKDRAQNIPIKVINNVIETLDATMLPYHVNAPFYLHRSDCNNDLYRSIMDRKEKLTEENLLKIPVIKDQIIQVYVANSKNNLNTLLRIEPSKNT